MNRPYPFSSFAFAILLAFGAAACSTEKHSSTGATAVAGNEAMFAPPDHLTGVLTNGDVQLQWSNNPVAADGGNWVEFATPGSEFTKLVVFLRDTGATEFVHPRVAPESQFIYHLQPFFGQASTPEKIITGEASTNGPALEEGPLPPDTNRVTTAAQKVSMRTPQTLAAATPDLTATLSSPTSVDLRWADKASDEDGYVVEGATDLQGPYFVCALLPPDTESFRKIELPAQTNCFFRVRAFFYGKPSDTVSVMTSPGLK